MCHVAALALQMRDASVFSATATVESPHCRSQSIAVSPMPLVGVKFLQCKAKAKVNGTCLPVPASPLFVVGTAPPRIWANRYHWIRDWVLPTYELGLAHHPNRSH